MPVPKPFGSREGRVWLYIADDDEGGAFRAIGALIEGRQVVSRDLFDIVMVPSGAWQ